VSVRLFDISHHNATADFHAAKRAGYAGVYLKATEGSYTDPTFAERKVAAQAAGLKVGAYLFFHPGQDVAAQVALFHKVAGHCDLRVALDFEVTDNLGSAECAVAARTALSLLALAYGYAPIVYTYPSFGVNCDGLDGFPLWIADYSGKKTPRVPAQWHGDWALWQTGQAAVPGVAPGDGNGTDVSTCPSLARLIVPPAPPTKGKPVTGKSNLTDSDWETLGALADKIILHVRHGADYDLSTMQKEISDLKGAVAALKNPAGFGN
jgi:lysozyme